MSGLTLQLGLIALIGVPVLLLVLWPLFRKDALAPSAAPAAPQDRRLELAEDKAAALLALKELGFDHEAGHLSDEDYQALRAGYEARAAQAMSELDRLGPAPSPVPTAPEPAVTREAGRGWTRSPAALAAGAALLVVFGLVIGLNVGRFTEPEQPPMPPGAGAGMPDATGATPGGAGAMPPGRGGADATGPLPPETLAGMLGAAREALKAGRYQEAIPAYQAILRRDPGNVDAMTHLALIVAIGGHADQALQSLDRALAIDGNYALAHLYRGQVLYEMKQDYAGAIKEWERFLALVPSGEDHARVRTLIDQARARQRAAR